MSKAQEWMCGQCGVDGMLPGIDDYCDSCGRHSDYMTHIYDTGRSGSPKSSFSRRPDASSSGRQVEIETQRSQNVGQYRISKDEVKSRKPIEKLHHDTAEDSDRSRSPESSVSRGQDASSLGRRIDLKTPRLQIEETEEDEIKSRKVMKSLEHAIAADYVGDLFVQSMSQLQREMLAMSPMVDKSRFVDKFQGLLEQFSVELSENSQTDLELAISRLLRSRHTRKRIASRIVRNCVTYNDEIVLETPESSSDESEDEDDEIPNGSELRDFVRGSNACKNLVTGLKVLLLPQNLRPVSRIMMTMPSESVWFSDEEDLSLSNKFKLLAEQISNVKWHWWPLRPRMQLLQKDETRMHWRCVSGTQANSRVQMTTKSSSIAAGIFGPRSPPLM